MSAAIPLTRLQHDGLPRVGQRFVARTVWGRLGFDDTMVVDVLRPPVGDQPRDQPGLVEIVKQGRVVGGTVRCTSPHRHIGTTIGAKPRRTGVWSRWRYRYDDRVADNREQAPPVPPPGARKLGLRHPR